MGLISYPVPGKEKSRLICRAFEAGAPKHATGSVFFGTEGVMDAFQRAKSGTWWYIDNAYFDRCRGTYFRVTKNALQVDPRGKTSFGARFRSLGITIRPWRDPLGSKVLVIPQSESFMKSTLGKPGDWVRETLHHLKVFGVPDSEIRVRPWLRDKVKAYVELRQDLLDARLVVTWSSASAITALLEGVPAISESGAATWLTGPLIADTVRDPHRPGLVERAQFAAILADNQFTLDEFRDGTAWRWLEGADHSKE